MNKELKSKLKKMQLFVAVSLLLVLTLFLFNNTGITGHFSADFKTQTLDLVVEQSQVYSIRADTTELIEISSLRISGSVSGGGSVEIYLQDQDKKLMIYSNRKEKEQGLTAVTGLSVADAAEGEEEQLTIMMVPESTIEWEPGLSLAPTEVFGSGPFNNKCMDTCFMEMVLGRGSSYNLVFMIEPGTRVELNKIIYTLKNENV